MILKNCTFFNELFEKEFGDIKIENGRITAIGYFNEDGIDMQDNIILPGFVDIHIHGGGGADVCDGTVQSINEISKYLAKKGITSFCPTTMTLPIDRLVSISDAVASYKCSQSSGAKVVGINYEGPFISKQKCGAQNKEYVIVPEDNIVDALLNIGLMKIITIAPEAFDSDDFIKSIVSRDVAVSIGHTCADANACQRAIDMGAKHITHLYNAMTPMSHRLAGVVGTALDNNVTCELICDGEHICPTVLRNTFKILGEDRAVVVSDSMRGAGVGEGEYELGGQMTFVKEGYKVAKLADGTIAASITNVYDQFKNLLSFGIDFKTALKSCTINPAKVVCEQDNIGSIAVGKWADLIVADMDLNIKEVYINGTLA